MRSIPWTNPGAVRWSRCSLRENLRLGQNDRDGPQNDPLVDAKPFAREVKLTFSRVWLVTRVGPNRCGMSTTGIDQLFDQTASLQNEPTAVRLATHSALASAKLAAALSGDNVDEIGMTIAYLKRALKAVTISMDAAAQLRKLSDLISPAQHAVLQQRLFRVRDGIITLMGEYRSEWRRRFGSEGFRS